MSELTPLNEVFAKALAVDVSLISDSLQYQGIVQWDSVAHMQLIAALEDSYDVMLDTDDIIDMSSVAKAREILAKYGVNV
ncbi:acyl carrier protein [Celerinatantimonas sp. MCCC 1A17872]|uniref:acyl carrier protein n=1 Tax=Celerinatantimonas sp. MCCC 1A17872 TaxID=3177514 RepID=UPI0038C5EA97